MPSSAKGAHVAKGKAALVTGSATGIGRAVAWQLAERGVNVVVNYSRSQAEAEETSAGVEERGSRAIVCKADVSDEKAVATMAKSAIAAFGGIDYLVNNAATTYFIEHADIEQMSAEKWDRIFAVNVKGAFYCMRECVASLRERSGAIVNISSVAALTGQGSCMAYAASKAALLNMTRSWARAFAPQVRCNAVLPGPVTSRWLLDAHADMLEAGLQQTPMQRVCSPADAADAVRYFLLETDFVTGHYLVVDGGRTMP
jgi:3-oxoacyl-[acyl-carrier protein] reductase